MTGANKIKANPKDNHKFLFLKFLKPSIKYTKSDATNKNAIYFDRKARPSEMANGIHITFAPSCTLLKKKSEEDHNIRSGASGVMKINEKKKIGVRFAKITLLFATL
jgi:hypothetical protein